DAELRVCYDGRVADGLDAARIRMRRNPREDATRREIECDKAGLLVRGDQRDRTPTIHAGEGARRKRQRRGADDELATVPIRCTARPAPEVRLLLSLEERTYGALGLVAEHRHREPVASMRRRAMPGELAPHVELRLRIARRLGQFAREGLDPSIDDGIEAG